jgi:hypothetical protein
MKIRAAVAAAAVAAALSVPATGFANTWLEFTRQSNTSSPLTLATYYTGGFSTSQTFRAGSGVSTDACWLDHGWLPPGWYDLKGHWDNYDADIKGRVFYLQNKQCWNGTWRSQLFIHSEETAAQGQYCPTAGDDPYCWEGDTDYYSHGCIKISRLGNPSDLRKLHDGWHAQSGDSRHGAFTVANFVYVR